MRSLGLWIGVWATGTAVAASGPATKGSRFVELHTRALPGFDIDLPDGYAGQSRLTEYRKGELTLHVNGTPSSVQVLWGPLQVWGEAEVASFYRAAGLVSRGEPHPMSPPDIAIPGLRTRSLAVRAGEITSLMTLIECGSRHVQVMSTSTTSSGLEDFHRRMVTSCRCHPDALKETSVGEVPVTFDLGPGWFRLPSGTNEILLTDGKQVLSAGMYNGSMADLQTLQQFRAANPSFRVGHRVGDDWQLDTSIGGEPVHGWVTVRACPAAGGALIVMALGGDDGPPVNRKLLTRARCRKPDEPVQVWKALPPQPAAR